MPFKFTFNYANRPFKLVCLGDAASTWSSGRQMSIREWDIPYEELKIMDKISSGRFSTVHMENWHGDVAIKVLDVENLEDETAALEAFKLDVATFRSDAMFSHFY